jgi:antitoxin (DNA-binding transcriptional repressor) of toxin-antitoxin stability system
VSSFSFSFLLSLGVVDLVHYLVYIVTMIRLNIHEAKTHLSRYLSMIVKGETILLCKRNQPIAEIRPLQSRRTQKRPIGLAKGRFAVPKEFFEPLPEELVQAFQGETQ